MLIRPLHFQVEVFLFVFLICNLSLSLSLLLSLPLFLSLSRHSFLSLSLSPLLPLSIIPSLFPLKLPQMLSHHPHSPPYRSYFSHQQFLFSHFASPLPPFSFYLSLSLPISPPSISPLHKQCVTNMMMTLRSTKKTLRHHPKSLSLLQRVNMK